MQDTRPGIQQEIVAQPTHEALSASTTSTPNTPRGSWLSRVSHRASHIPNRPLIPSQARDTLPLRNPPSDRLITTVLSPAFRPATPTSPTDTEFGVTPIDATFGDRIVTPPRKVKAEEEMDKYSKQAGDATYDSDADADDEFERSMVGSPSMTKEYADDQSDHPSESEDEQSIDGEDTPTTQGWAERGSPKGSIADWTTEDVADFIVTLSLKQYSQSFMDEEVNGEALIALQHDELRELGINSVGHRLTILKAVYEQKQKTGIQNMDGDYTPLSVEADKLVTQDDIERVIMALKVRDQRIIATEAELRTIKQDLDRVMDDNRKLREEALPALRLMKDQRTPLPDPAAGTIPSPREIEIMPNSATLKDKGSSLSRKFSTKKLFLPGAKQPSPTHPPASVRDDGHLEASAAAVAASTHLTASMTSQTSPGVASQPLSPASPAYSQPSSGGSYQPSNARSSTRHFEEQNSAHTTWSSGTTLVEPTSARREDRSRRQAPTPNPREDEAGKDNPQVEIFKSFRVSIEDPCEVVLPVALKRYNIHDDWRQYSLYIVHGDQERCLGLKEKPLMLFKQLDKEGRKPMFMLRRHASPQNGWTGSVGGSAAERHTPGGVL